MRDVYAGFLLETLTIEVRGSRVAVAAVIEFTGFGAGLFNELL
jgi:hypothetical protein